MFTSILSATTWYADLALIVLIALFAIIGAIRGFGKSLKGVFMAIVIILASALLVGVIHGPVMETSVAASLEDKLLVASDGWGDAFTEDIYYVDNNYCIHRDDGTYQRVDEVDNVKGMIAEKVASKLLDKDSDALNPAIDTARTSIAKTCVYNLASLIVAVCLFFILCIGMSLVLTLIKMATKGAHKSESGAVRAIDRTLGAIVGLASGAIFVFLVLAILTTVADKATLIVSYIEDSTICKFFYDLNPIGKVFEKIFTNT